MDDQKALKAFLDSKKDISHYIFEKFYSYSREYRLHCTQEGCFYTCRKMLKTDAPKENKWQRHDDNCVWIIEENPNFEKPVNWDEIVKECLKALEACELDIASFDVIVQGTNDKNGNPRTACDFIIIECNSASSFGETTAKKYTEVIPKLAEKLALDYGILKRVIPTVKSN